MKVLFLNLYDDPAVSGGGAEMTLHHLTQGLASRGWEVVMLATSQERGLSMVERDGVRIWRAGIRNLYWPKTTARPHAFTRMAWHLVDSYNLAMQPFLRRVLELEKPDVVSAHNLPGWSVASWATVAKFGIPLVQVLHDMYLICPKATMRTSYAQVAKTLSGAHSLTTIRTLPAGGLGALFETPGGVVMVVYQEKSLGNQSAFVVPFEVLNAEGIDGRPLASAGGKLSLSDGLIYIWLAKADVPKAEKMLGVSK